MRVKIDNFGKVPYFGEFVGIYKNDYPGDTDSVIVRPDNFGLYLMSVHPSRVTFVTPDQEEDHKP